MRDNRFATFVLVVALAYPVTSYADDNASFQAGIAAYQDGNLPLAYKDFMAAARQGHADSQYNVGLMYERGLGVDKDLSQAVNWYGKSADQGNAAAQFNLGVLYENGRGIPVDFAKAADLYRKASAQRDPLAIGNLGELYLRGQGVAEDKVAGVALLLLSATLDPSPENHAKMNLAKTPGLTTPTISAAQDLLLKFNQADNIVIPLDKYLTEAGGAQN